MALGQHIRIRLTNDGVLAPTATARRLLARAVIEQGRRFVLLAFGLADTHLHVEAACSRPEAGQLAHAIEVSLRGRGIVTGAFAPAQIKPIDDTWHLYDTFRCVLRQDERHALALDPSREATNLPDLLGLRLIGAYTRANVRRLLPRIKRAELLALMGIEKLEAGASAPVERLVEATLASCGLADLGGRSAEALVARRALLEVAAGRVPVRGLAELAKVDERSLYRLKKRPADHDLVRAIRLQLDLGGHPPGAPGLDDSLARLDELR